MAIFDKVMFWKKKDETALPNPNRDIGLGFNDFSQPYPQQYPQQGFMPQPGVQQMPPADAFQGQQNFRQDRDMELISAKLDAIKAMLENLNQRVGSLEKIARGDEDINNIRRRW